MPSSTPMHGDPSAAIARDALRVGTGGRLPTTTHYQDTLGVGSGTVQKALRGLRDERALSLVARGHQGTFVTALDTGKLWSAARLAPVHLLLPPNAPPEATHVARAVARVFAGWGILTTVGHQRGAEGRLAALDRQEADLALVSAGAASDLLRPDSTQGHRSISLGEWTYYAPGTLVTVSRAGVTAGHRPGPLRVALDPASDDHRRLTEAQFPPNGVEYVEADFTQVPRAVLLGTIDTGVWHTVDTLIPLEAAGLRTTPLSTPKALQLAAAISAAVLVATEDNLPGILLERAAPEIAAPRRSDNSTAGMPHPPIRFDAAE
ncbi:YhfZ family protein [Streptomyces sp. NRRL F-5123]|uniref:YhfZ family protein n=1 Tax=Streptomyces sp. NRRL F-5123 TaxID=1463856 RepID=UPI00131C55CB|nr:YhfZ family protein [Streptomyces sp. NRRL F-5123]